MKEFHFNLHSMYSAAATAYKYNIREMRAESKERLNRRGGEMSV